MPLQGLCALPGHFRHCCRARAAISDAAVVSSGPGQARDGVDQGARGESPGFTACLALVGAMLVDPDAGVPFSAVGRPHKPGRHQKSVAVHTFRFSFSISCAFASVATSRKFAFGNFHTLAMLHDR